MKRVGWLVAALVVGIGLSAWADCGCAPAGDPACYTTFRVNQTIQFTVIVSLDFFTAHATTETPLITGWRVEKLDGTVVRRVVFDWPVGLVRPLEWRLVDDAGAWVGEGFYRIVVETTSAGEVQNTVRLVACYTPPACGTCLCSCSDRVPPCSRVCGEAFLALRVGETRDCCCGFGVTLIGSFTWETPAP